MKNLSLMIITLSFISFELNAQNPIMSWDFTNANPIDTIEGYYEKVPAVKGLGLRLDGFTTRVIRKAENVTPVYDELSIQSWIALGNYPWNWCPILTTESGEIKGYRLMVGPYGQLSMQVAVDEQWIVCTSKTSAIPLRKWINVTGTYKAKDKIQLFINGVLVNTVDIKGRMTVDLKADCIIGMVAKAEKPSNIYNTSASVEQFFGLDGILDEVSIFDKVLSDSEIKSYANTKIENDVDIEPRKMPYVKSTRNFHAYYTKLKYYPSWDNIWRVGNDPDIVVCFEDSPVRLVFWRGIRYGASWVSENGNWMTDQSVEAWNDKEGCFEHMQDRHCRFSHVRIIENTPARIVVHWRYAPVSSHDNTWRVDEKTGWECWIDEYYYIYPDASAIRKVNWTTGSLGYPRQFQESLPLSHPEQKMSDLLEKDYAFVADYNGKKGVEKFTDKFGLSDNYHNYTIQRYNLKSEFKPFICFEPGNYMTLKNAGIESYDKYGVCDHFPVGQARCDGRFSVMGDRPASSMGFPISDPVIHKDSVNNRSYWCGMYGMNGMSMEGLIMLGRSWAYAPELKSNSSNFISKGYDRSERCYKLSKINSISNQALKVVIDASEKSPLINPLLNIENCDSEKVEIKINGKLFKKAKIGLNKGIDKTHLLVFIPLTSFSKTEILLTFK